eukprot:TRINITY_DN913_c0_g1_i1.p1 TRINITY_DN913_c0_g1~~TRINITY_DN913_c0_g1_i1.p1  ORF type:complete len:234 (+),score=71.73 TRINITY_DN913_c0_g1_i1:89-790(+)
MNRHVHFTCDGCGIQSFPGVRFNCTECPNYDLCSSCYKMGRETNSHSSGHRMLSFLPNRSRPLEDDDDEEVDDDDGEDEGIYDGGDGDNLSRCPICAFLCSSVEMPLHMLNSHQGESPFGSESLAGSKYGRLLHRPSQRLPNAYGFSFGAPQSTKRPAKKIQAPSSTLSLSQSSPSHDSAPTSTADFRFLLSTDEPSKEDRSNENDLAAKTEEEEENNKRLFVRELMYSFLTC